MTNNTGCATNLETSAQETRGMFLWCAFNFFRMFHPLEFDAKGAFLKTNWVYDEVCTLQAENKEGGSRYSFLSRFGPPFAGQQQCKLIIGDIACSGHFTPRVQDQLMPMFCLLCTYTFLHQGLFLDT